MKSLVTKRIATLLFTATLSLNACSSSPQSIAESHLELVKTSKAGEANQQYCVPKDTLRLHTVSTYKASAPQTKTRDGYTYTEVLADVETDQYRFKNVDIGGGVMAPKKEVLKQVTIEIWNSDDFYQTAVKSNAKLNDLIQSSSVLTGVSQKTPEAPKRESINKDKSCVFLPFDQFQSDQ